LISIVAGGTVFETCFLVQVGDNAREYVSTALLTVSKFGEARGAETVTTYHLISVLSKIGIDRHSFVSLKLKGESLQGVGTTFRIENAGK
jgi:hypothetical protein